VLGIVVPMVFGLICIFFAFTESCCCRPGCMPIRYKLGQISASICTRYGIVFSLLFLSDLGERLVVLYLFLSDLRERLVSSPPLSLSLSVAEISLFCIRVFAQI
jgi:hypothetical protein